MAWSCCCLLQRPLRPNAPCSPSAFPFLHCSPLFTLCPPSLLACHPQVHLKLGLWRRSLTEELSEGSIASIMANLRAATEHGPAWGKVRCRGHEGGGDSRKGGRGSRFAVGNGQQRCAEVEPAGCHTSAACQYATPAHLQCLQTPPTGPRSTPAHLSRPGTTGPTSTARPWSTTARPMRQQPSGLWPLLSPASSDPSSWGRSRVRRE